jgi:hypothetical protein
MQPGDRKQEKFHEAAVLSARKENRREGRRSKGRKDR